MLTHTHTQGHRPQHFEKVAKMRSIGLTLTPPPTPSFSLSTHTHTLIFAYFLVIAEKREFQLSLLFNPPPPLERVGVCNRLRVCVLVCECVIYVNNNPKKTPPKSHVASLILWAVIATLNLGFFEMNLIELNRVDSMS